LFGQRGFSVEPVQGLVKNIFDLDNRLMRGGKNNRWLFAAMGVAVQIAQLAAYRKNLSHGVSRMMFWGSDKNSPMPQLLRFC